MTVTLSEMGWLLLFMGSVAALAFVVTEFFAKMEERRRSAMPPPSRALALWLDFSYSLGQDFKALFWTVVGVFVLSEAGWFEVRGEGWLRYVILAGFSIASYAVAAKVGYEWLWKTVIGGLRNLISNWISKIAAQKEGS